MLLLCKRTRALSRIIFRRRNGGGPGPQHFNALDRLVRFKPAVTDEEEAFDGQNKEGVPENSDFMMEDPNADEVYKKNNVFFG